MHSYQIEKTIVGLFFAQAHKYGNDVFLKSKLERGRPVERWVPLTWNEVEEEVRKTGEALIEAGVVPGERVAIFAHNQPRWIVADLAIQGVQAWGVPIYPTSTDEQLEFILNDCMAKGLFVGDPFLLEQALRVKPRVPSLRFIVSMAPLEKEPNPIVTAFDSLLPRGGSSVSALDGFDIRRRALTGDHVAAIIYTSGTTGEPKGAVLTQANFMADLEMMLSSTLTSQTMARGLRLTSLCHLPLCHIYGRTSDYHVQIAMGGTICFAENYQKVQQNLLEIRPQMLITIPRVYEKVYETVQHQGEKLKGIPRKLFDWSRRVGDKVVGHMSRGERLPFGISLQYALAGALVYGRIKRLAGLDRVAMAASGGGALSEKINRFFRAMNIMISEGYGLTETTSALTWNSLEFRTPLPDRWIYPKSLDWLLDVIVIMQGRGRNPFWSPVGIFKLSMASNFIVPLLVQKPGTVGPPCINTEIKIAEDGEILARGPQIFGRDKGYFNRSDLTAEVFTDDGFFKTGDIGAFDQDGYLIITDRKKELLVTAGGKNIAPSPIEIDLTLDPLIEQACVIGEGKKYLSALIVPQFKLLEKWARRQGIEFSDHRELVAHPEVQKLFEEKVNKVNERLARWEQIKKFRVLPVIFSVETGELTPSEKKKRRVINEKFKEEIASCY